MIRLYYVESKTYFHDALNVEHQIADGGEMPNLFTSKKKAMDFAKRVEKFNIERFDYHTLIPDNEYPCKKDNCLYAVRQTDKKTGMRIEIRVYSIYAI